MKYAPTSLISTLIYGLLSIGAEGCSSLSADKPGAMALQALGRSDERSRGGMRVLDSLSFISGGAQVLGKVCAPCCCIAMLRQASASLSYATTVW